MSRGFVFASHVRLQTFSLMQDGVHCALEVSRLQLEEWHIHGPRAQEEALTQKALLQEELVTIRARMCDVSLVCKDSWLPGNTSKRSGIFWVWTVCLISPSLGFPPGDGEGVESV